MPILPALAIQSQCLFPATENGEERWRWFMLTVQAILVPVSYTHLFVKTRVIMYRDEVIRYS